jgi:hypothetical protein
MKDEGEEKKQLISYNYLIVYYGIPIHSTNIK